MVEAKVDHVECPVPPHGGGDALGEESAAPATDESVRANDLPHDRGRGGGHGLVRTIRLHLDLLVHRRYVRKDPNVDLVIAAAQDAPTFTTSKGLTRIASVTPEPRPASEKV